MAKLWFRAETEPSVLLPPLCPSCLSVGVRALSVPHAAGGPGRTAYYCDRCADRLERASTLLAARLAACGLIGVGMATSTALLLGGSRLGLQIMLTFLGVVVPLGLTFAWEIPGARPALIELEGTAKKSVWLALRKDYLEQLGETSTTLARAPRRSLAPALIPLLVAWCWLGALHFLGRAELRVIHASDAEALVLIDERRRAVTPPSRSEHPTMARSVSTLAGRRTLSVVTERGEPVVSVVRTLWPGRAYLLGTLPEGQCLFLERREYGSEGAAHELVPVPDTGPLWEFPDRIDLWFKPLRERPDLPTTGGVRTALRLLPCR